MALWIETESVELRPNATEDNLQAVIRAVYRQVLGNTHVLDNQRLTSAESQLRNGDITVRDFVRAVAESDLYRSRFFETSSPYRFVELNFKHLLGRAPQDQAEIAEHVQIYNNQGYEAEVNSYISSDEYFSSFGENIAPSTRGNRTQTGLKNVGFNRTFCLTRGFAANDVGKSAKLINDVAGNLPTKIKAPARGSGAVSNTGKRFRITSTTNTAVATLNRVSKKEYIVSYNQMSQEIQSLIKNGAKILSITEVA
ncbi:MAG: phycobilisome rod-core linker polypeptide [Pseudanabaenales cyanobacterium]|nr:phycobilisome rod-core linker polypeptide [Pseudanabaenales cyanobacterium]